MATEEKLGRFGHHPDPAIDFCVEVEALQGAVHDVIVGYKDDPNALLRRIEVALSTNWLDQSARDAGRALATDGSKLLAWMGLPDNVKGAQQLRHSAKMLLDNRGKGDCSAVSQAILLERRAAELEAASAA